MLAGDFRGSGPGVVVARMWLMRIATGVVLLACVCCTRNPSPPPSGTVRVACRTSVADYCAANVCDQTLVAAEQNSSVCPATITACNDITVMSQNRGDTSTLWYYQGGPLVAIVRQLAPGGQQIGRASC